ncbi:hypothetical protein MHB50_04160 [Siminovitchia sp. FSL H7-0308]|uniref:Uncharacterized protein n=1 Tax=Siminovitchia thermophila TaxID=1245522 RepID=A0ABS2R8V2_9BACI|nr:hypothetical protein [Siminovitchia thermophila]MBM7715273.1 hypothetical protein [Siminovitchia thermophila]ONK24008.1 hypothetical protein BLX87_07115 [Bacillus sp. VT-16-64]
MQLLQFGTFTIPLHWVLALLSLVGGWLLTSVYVKHHQMKKESLEMIINALFVIGVVWKFSIVVFDFDTVKAHVSSVLYFTGGTKGFFLGLFVSFLYLYRQAKKKKIYKQLSETLLLFGTAGYGLYLFLHAITQGENLFIILSFVFTTTLFIVWLWDRNALDRLPKKAGLIFIVYAMIFQLPNELTLAEWSLAIIFPLCAILLSNNLLVKENV